MLKTEIDRFVNLKSGWINRKLVESQVKTDQRNCFELHYGDLILYRGRSYPIQMKPGNRVGFDGECFWMPPDLSPKRIKAACVQIYRLFAKQVITEKIQVYAKRMNVFPSDIKINGAKTRWGSCSAKKSLNFSWRLVMADDAVIDYVVVHELAHIIEMNHSVKFWEVIGGVLPDYKGRQKQLKELQSKLSAEYWE